MQYVNYIVRLEHAFVSGCLQYLMVHTYVAKIQKTAFTGLTLLAVAVMEAWDHLFP
jgi:hypothetical protein